MVTTYKAIDLSYFYEEFPLDYAYLILHTSDKQEENISRKVKAASRRFIDFKYSKNQEVQVLLMNDESKLYEVVDVPCENGVYRVDELLLNIFWDIEPIVYSEWVELKDNLKEKTESISISEYAVLTEKYDYDLNCSKQVQLLNDSKLQDMELSLKKISCYGAHDEIDTAVLDKCLAGEDVSVGDFFAWVEETPEDAYISVDFDTLHLHITNENVSVYKKIGSANESFSCFLSKKRLGMPSMFFAGIVRAEAEKRTLQFLNDYVLS